MSDTGDAPNFRGIRDTGDIRDTGNIHNIRHILGRVEVFGTTPPHFDVDNAPDDPLELFAEWLEDAVGAGVRDPHAMTLSTVDERGLPDARVLILRDATAEGWAFGTSSSSPKGRQLAASPAAALTFYWPERGRQVRVRGPVVTGSAEESAASFLGRGPGGRAESFLGLQSTVIGDPNEPARVLGDVRDRVEREPDLVSPTWTIYRVVPEAVEFWQASRDRSHLRLRYTSLTGAGDSALSEGAGEPGGEGEGKGDGAGQGAGEVTGFGEGAGPDNAGRRFRRDRLWP